MRRVMAVLVALIVVLVPACNRGAARTPTTRTAFPTSSTATTEPPATVAPTTTAPPPPTGDDDKPQVQAVKDFFRVQDQATLAKNPDLIDPYVDDETADHFAATAKRQIIDDIAHGRFEGNAILATRLVLSDSIGPDQRHQAGVLVTYKATDELNHPVKAEQVFGVVWSTKRQRWLVFSSGTATVTAE